jgi:peptide/nickel transport system substrate-binding protein
MKSKRPSQAHQSIFSIIVVVLVLLSLLLSACAKGNSPATASEKPKAGGTLTISLTDSDVRTFDPTQALENSSIWVNLQVYDQLVRVGADGKSVEPDLATSWDVNTDGTEYTFHLRPNITFHDGTPITSSDVKFSILRGADPKSGWSWIYPKMTDIQTPDTSTIKFILATPWAPFVADMALFASSILPEKALTAQGDNFFQKPIGSGPFMFVSWDKGSKIVLKKNPNYWETGYPLLDEVDFLYLPDDNARMLQFQGGQLDIATNVPWNQIDSLKKDTNVDMQIGPMYRMDYMVLNNTRDPFKDINIRQAMNYAVDKEAIIKAVLFGKGQVANTILPPMLDWNDQLKPYPFDLQKAKDLMAKSHLPNGFSTTLQIWSGDAVARSVATIVKDQLSKINIQVDVVELDGGTVFTNQSKLDYDMIFTYLTTDIIDPDELITYAFVGTSSTNAHWSGYDNPVIDKLATDAAQMMKPVDRKTAYYKIQEMSTNDAQGLLMYYTPPRTAVSTHVHDFAIPATGNYRLWLVWKQ